MSCVCEELQLRFSLVGLNPSTFFTKKLVRALIFPPFILFYASCCLCLSLVSPLSLHCLSFVSPLSRPCLALVSPLSRPCLALVSPCLALVSPLSRPCLALSRPCLARVLPLMCLCQSFVNLCLWYVCYFPSRTCLCKHFLLFALACLSLFIDSLCLRVLLHNLTAQSKNGEILRCEANNPSSSYSVKHWKTENLPALAFTCGKGLSLGLSPNC